MGVDGKWAAVNARLEELGEERDRLHSELEAARGTLAAIEHTNLADAVAERNALKRKLDSDSHSRAAEVLTFDREEQEAMDAIDRALELIGRHWGLRANREELVAAVHTVQSFVVQHMLARVIGPPQWSDWWGDGKGN